MKYIKFNLNQKVAIAVSGGKDSMSLAIYTQKIYPEVKIIALIVDHKLREESTREALFAQNELAKYNIESYILTWNNPVASQERARNARYDLMTAKCYELKIDTLLFGHHLNDVIETYLMRLENNSGQRGLASIHSKNYYNGIRILRPMIQNLKEDILPLTNWIEDRSNTNTKFTRVRIRNRVTPSEYDSLIRKIQYYSALRYEHDMNITNQLKVLFYNQEKIIIDYQSFSSLDSTLQLYTLDKIKYYMILYNISLYHDQLIITRQKKNWFVQYSDQWQKSICHRFFIKGKNIIYNHFLSSYPLSGKYISIVNYDLFNVWYDHMSIF